MKDGIYEGRGIVVGSGLSVTAKGKAQVIVKMEVKGTDEAGKEFKQVVEGQWSLEGGAKPITFKMLESLGWGGNLRDFSGLAKNAVKVLAKTEDYNGALSQKYSVVQDAVLLDKENAEALIESLQGDLDAYKAGKVKGAAANGRPSF